MQVQFIQLAQWMSGVAASIIAGTSILVPNFSIQTADDAAEQPKKKEQRIVRRIETNGKINEDIDELLRKYNIDVKDSAGIQTFSFSDDSSSAEIIIIDQDMLDGSAMQFHMADSVMRFHTFVSDSLVHFHMPRFDTAMGNRTFQFKRFDKEFSKKWRPQMDSMMKNQKFIFKNFDGMMDSTLRNFKFDFKMIDSSMKHFKFDYKMMDSELKNLDSELENLDSELEKMEIEIEGLNEEIRVTAPDGAKLEKNVIITTAPNHHGVAIVNGTGVKRDGKTRVFMMKNGCGNSLKTCEKRVIIDGNPPMPPDAPLPPNGVMPVVPPFPSVAVAPFPHMTKNARVVIIKKKGSKKEKTEQHAQEQIAAKTEEEPIDRGRYIPGDYTEANPWNLNLSPNPTNGVLNISCEMPSKEIPVTLGVYDLQGNQVFLKEGISPMEFQNMPLDLTGNPTGTYLIQIAQGDRTFTSKFEISK
ncbi:MAG: T9SS type A sorting domain-containing protein [Bacteroidota bacterium]